MAFTAFQFVTFRFSWEWCSQSM